MSRSKLALLLACALSLAMSTAMARDVERLSAADAGGCPADLAAEGLGERAWQADGPRLGRPSGQPARRAALAQLPARHVPVTA